MPSIEPARTPLEQRILGPLIGLLLLLGPFVVAAWIVNALAGAIDGSAGTTIRWIAEPFAAFPEPLRAVLVGPYGMITMGPLLFVWAVPTVIAFALILGIYKQVGMLERITVALTPASAAPRAGCSS